jgi:hypothetical protein
MIDWLISRTAGERKGPVRYIQSQNSNLLGEFQSLQKDICQLNWANECFGTQSFLPFLTRRTP